METKKITTGSFLWVSIFPNFLIFRPKAMWHKLRHPYYFISRLFYFAAISFVFTACQKEENCALGTANATVQETYYSGNQISEEYIRCGFFGGTFRVIDEAFRELSLANWEGATKNKIDFVFAGELSEGVYYAENKELYWSYVDVYCDVVHQTEFFGKQVYLRQLEDVEFNLHKLTYYELSAVVTGKVTLSPGSFVKFRIELEDVPYIRQARVPGN